MRFSFLLIFFFFSLIASSQNDKKENPITADSISKANKNAAKMQAFLKKAVYPHFKMSKWSGVIPVDNPTEVPDRSMQYKLLMEDVYPVTDSSAKEINGGLAEIGRLINLHIASSIPMKNLHVVAVVHGAALFALVKDDVYNKKFRMNNPNEALIKELMESGVQFIACGQAMYFYDINKNDLIDNIKVSLTAQTVLTSYQLKGYVLHIITEDK